jgi:Rhodopirellula transposase DDE domain
MDQEASVREKFSALAPVMDERMTRLWVAAEAQALGHGGIALVERATGIRAKRIREGMHDLDELVNNPPVEAPTNQRIRRPGGGRSRLTEKDPTLFDDLESLVEPFTRGDPESPLRWTCKSTRKLAVELNQMGHEISPSTVGYRLWDLGYRLHANAKVREGKQHVDRNAQFEHINAEAAAFLARGDPVISVDTKKKELVGNFKNNGREWEPVGDPVRVLVHDFADPKLGKAIPYGVYDIAHKEGWVSIGIDHNTAQFAVASIGEWWRSIGRPAYPVSRDVLVTADAGGCNGYRNRLWKVSLQAFADQTGLAVSVCHFPPGTSKWNKIEHELFSYIAQNWRGRPLVNHQVIIELIRATTTKTGLTVGAQLDSGRYDLGIKVTEGEMDALNITKDNFHGEWNYHICPRQS